MGDRLKYVLLCALILECASFKPGTHTTLEYSEEAEVKEVSKQEGKAIMKDMWRALQNKPVQAKIRHALRSLDDQGIDAAKRRAGREANLKQLLDQVTHQARMKHGMSGGFWAVLKACERYLRMRPDRELEAVVNDVFKLVLEEPGPTYVGRVKELGDFAHEFLAMDADSKADALAVAVKLRGKLKKKGELSQSADAERYADIMRGFIKHGPQYFEILGSELSKQMRFEDSQSEQWLDGHRRMNALRDFLNDGEIDRLMDRIEYDRERAKPPSESGSKRDDSVEL